jgi:Holliday junction resolvase-like predicted endonuclease
MPIGVWLIKDEGPRRLAPGDVALEKHLEDWIERDPTLLEEGLTIVGRQVSTDGGRLDLLAVDPQGRWVVIEIKAGSVRRETIAQALDYASCIATIPKADLVENAKAYLSVRASDEDRSRPVGFLNRIRAELEDDDAGREVRIFVVGTGRDRGLERMVNYLSERGEIEIGVVSFEVFTTDLGEQLLTRELTEADSEASSQRISGAVNRLGVEGALEQAQQNGIGEPFRLIYDAAVGAGLYARPFKRSIMYTPPTNKSRYLVTLWTKPLPDGRLNGWVSTEAFTEFFGIDSQRVVTELGGLGRLAIAPEAAPRFAEGLRRLLEGRESSSNAGSITLP